MIYSTTDWMEVEEDCLNDELLLETFDKNIHKTVYVLRGGVIRGIVSHGDFCRYVTDGKPLVQESFTKCTFHDEERAKEILREKANIYSIPVLDGKGHIIREWCKDDNEYDGDFSTHILLRLYRQFVSDREGYLNILVVDLSEEEDAKAAGKINEETAGKLLIIDKKYILNINKYFEGVKPGIIYDYRKKYVNFVNLIYQKYGLKAEFLKKTKATHNLMDHILEFYGSAGILESEAKGLSDEYKQTNRICILDDDKFVWNQAGNCFEYKGNIENGEVPEVLWVSCCILKNPCIIYGNRVMPVIGSEYSIYEEYFINGYKSKWVQVKSTDYDIVYNIIPKLKENNIKSIIISNIDSEYKGIQGFDAEKAKRRAEMSRKDYINLCRSQFFNPHGGVSADEFYNDYENFLQGWNKRGYSEFKDYKGKHMNRSQGERLVLGNPEIYNHKLWLFGGCLILGIYVDDASNIGSVLRKYIDHNYYIKNMGASYGTRNFCIRDAVLSEGDIVVVQAYDNSIYENAGLKVHSLLDIYNDCSDLMEHIIDTPNHADAYLLEKIAERLYEILINEHMLEQCDDGKMIAETSGFGKQIRMRKERDKIEIPQGLKKWLADIQAYKGEAFSKTGAIVMNCNPFTLGHRYLIEQACEQVDKLLIFVLEEDKSFFKFEDRLEMVRIGTEDLGKVSVIPSGRYIISSETLPGYFEKEDNPNIVLDATDDLDFFAKVIAKELNISVRFAGEEPIDGYTRQYNQAMSKMMPQNYIDFVEIPRKEQDGSVISASRVRKLLKEKKYEDVRRLVLPQVYEYLEKHYFVQ